jgi:threonine dehydrogenase-like Zn-dependent dehydrogenase
MMKAAILQEANRVEICDLPYPIATQADEVIADVRFVGICKTDEQLTREGQMTGIVLGHEVVCQLPNQNSYFALNNELPCGVCSYCGEGETSHCVALRELGVNEHGGYAEQICVPQDSLYKFDFQNPLLGVLVEPISCAVRGVERILTAMNLLPVSSPNVLIIGGGMSGTLISYLLSHSPGFDGSLFLHDVSTAELAWTKQVAIERLAEPLQDHAHLVIECSGSDAGLATAMQVVRKAGLVCVYGVPEADSPLPIAAHDLFMREITVLTSLAGATDQTMQQAIDYISKDESFFEGLLGRRISLQELPQQLTHWGPLPGTRTVVMLEEG